MKTPTPNPTPIQADKSFISLAISPSVVIRALKVAIIVGSVLAFINHGEKILNWSFSGKDILKIISTYLVPYGVSTWSAVGAMRSKSK